MSGYNKKINGKEFYAVDSTSTKEKAQKIAKNWRKQGYKSRVIDTWHPRAWDDEHRFVIYIYPSPGEIPTVFTEYKR